MQRTLLTTLVLLAAISLAGCAGQKFALTSSTGTVQVSGQSAVRAGESAQFLATLPAGTTGSVQWSVNGIVGGDQSFGTISASGEFHAPATLPSENQVTIEATSVANSSVSGKVQVSLLNPTPSVTSAIATADSSGDFFKVNITGSNFVAGSVAKVDGKPVSTKVVSASSIQAIVPTSVLSASSANVSIANPEPGAVASEDIICQFQRTARPLRANLPEPSLPSQPFDYVAYAVTNVPAHMQLPNRDNTPQTNPITNAGATLGRVLFYDKRLSVNNTVSCASCHLQANGFADPAALSTGFAGGQTSRHGMALGNAKYYQRGRFFWDERAATLEEQALMPIQNAVEMGLTLPEMVAKLQSTTFYSKLFQDAFGTPEINSDRVSKALAQFMRSMMTYQSKFDQAAANNSFNTTFTASENNGRTIFNGFGACSVCHLTNAFVGGIPENTGLDPTITDVGAGNGTFKVPSLRNVAVRGRFMHDGRFTTLQQVVEFYNSGVQNNGGLSPVLRNGPTQPIRLNLSAQQKADLVAFLQTLTDNSFLTDPKFSNPFPN